MDKKEGISLFFVTLILIFLYLASSTDLFIKEKKVEVYKVSVLVDTVDNIGWENFKLGMDRAGLAYNIDLSFVTLYDENSSGQQKELLQRELKNGTDGIIISAEREGSLDELLELVPSSIPVVVYGSQVTSPRVKGAVSPQWELMAQELGTQIIEDENLQKNISIVTVNENRKNIELMTESLTNKLKKSGFTVTMIEISDYDDAQTLVNGLISQGGNIVISPEVKTLNGLAKAVGDRGEKLPLYGIGWNGDIWREIERGAIKATVATNGFMSGYIAVQTIANYYSSYDIVSEKVEFIEHRIITRETLYSKENQYIIFPIS